MLIAAAVLPHPPMLVPDVASGAADELDGVRGACLAAIAELQRSQPDLLVVVGAGRRDHEFPSGAKGSLRYYGVNGEFPTPDTARGQGAINAQAESLPLSLTIAAWQLQAAGWRGATVFRSVPNESSPDAAANVGGEYAKQASRVGVIAMGDGSAALTEKAPGHLVPGAVDWQQQVSSALGNADCVRILELTAKDADRFVAAGRVAWQVLAGAAHGRAWQGQLLHDSSPYGVAYTVATWCPVAA